MSVSCWHYPSGVAAVVGVTGVTLCSGTHRLHNLSIVFIHSRHKTYFCPCFKYYSILSQRLQLETESVCAAAESHLRVVDEGRVDRHDERRICIGFKPKVKGREMWGNFHTGAPLLPLQCTWS